MWWWGGADGLSRRAGPSEDERTRRNGFLSTNEPLYAPCP